MATFPFEEQCVIIRFLHLRGMKPIEIHQQLSETCNDGIMDVKNVRSWVQQFTEGRTSCENKPMEPPPRTSRSEDVIARVEQMVMEDCRLTVRQIAANAGISVGSVDTIPHDNLQLQKVSARWVPRGGVLPFGLTQPKEQPRLLQQLSRFYLLPFPRKKLGDLRP